MNTDAMLAQTFNIFGSVKWSLYWSPSGIVAATTTTTVTGPVLSRPDWLVC